MSRASTAARSASARFIPATSITARVSNVNGTLSVAGGPNESKRPWGSTAEVHCMPPLSCRRIEGRHCDSAGLQRCQCRLESDEVSWSAKTFEGVHNGKRLAQANVESSSLYVRCDGNWLNFIFRKWPFPLGSMAQHHTSTEERP